MVRAASGALALLLARSPAAIAATFEPLPHPGGLRSEPVATSGTGRFVLVNVFQESTSGHTPPSYRWDNGEVETLPCIFATDMSDDGRTITAQCQNLAGERHLWVDGELQLLPAGYRNHAQLTAVSGNGQAVFGTLPYEYCQTPDLCHDPMQAFRLVNGVAQDLGFLPGDHASLVTGASYDGSVAPFVSHLQDIAPSDEESGGPFQSDLYHAARWKASAQPQGSLLPLIPSAEQSFVNEVSSDGTTLVGDWFRWTEATGLQWLDILPGTEGARANGVSGNGAVIVGSYFTEAYPDGRASIWTEEAGLRDLQDMLVEELDVDLDGWELLSATDISTDASTIVGVGIDPDSGLVSGWRVRLLDEPIVVNVTGDEPNHPDSMAADECDVDIEEDDLQCTLRAAIELANERGGDRIIFDIPGNGVPRIEVVNVSGTEGNFDEGPPRLKSRITIDGTTQPGGFVEVVGLPNENGFARSLGLWVAPGGEHSEIRGLVVHGFQIGMVLEADSCVIEGNRIGTDPSGTIATGNGPGAFLYGSVIAPSGLHVGSSSNRIANNVIAGNTIRKDFSTAQVGISGNGNLVVGNRIGVGADGVVIEVARPSLRKERIGLHIFDGFDNVIGGETPDGEPPGVCVTPCNLMAGFDGHVVIRTTEPGSPNSVVGNWIGLDGGGQPFYPDESSGYGITVESADLVSDNRIRVARVGVSADSGSTVVGNDIQGQADFATTDTRLVGLIRVDGEGVTVRENIVRSFTHRGFLVEGTGHEITGNEIADNPLGGILVAGGGGHVISDNDIHDNSRGGVIVTPVFDDEPGAAITGNRIYANGIGIDLGGEIEHVDAPPWFTQIVGDGVTLNDVVDADDGGNGLQNFPDVLTATASGDDLLIEGFLETPIPGLSSYRIEVFGNTGCWNTSLSSLGGFVYGQGEEWLGYFEDTPGLGALDFQIALPFVGAPLTHVSLTATRTDLGVTSEFSRCMPLAAPGEVASADVSANADGLVLDDVGAAVSVGSSQSALRRAVGTGTVGAGKLFVTVYERAPDHNVYADAIATGPGGTAVEPDAVAPRYWYIADRGLTAAGGAGSATRTFDVCLDPAGVLPPDVMPATVVVQRNEETDGAWMPHETTSAQHGDATYLCASGLTELGEFALGTESDVLCGDLNHSGTLTASDALLILRASVGGAQCEAEPCRCDVNASGTISASDALATLKSAVTHVVLDSCPC